MCSSTLSLTSALDGSAWLAPSPGRFTPGKEMLHLLYRKLGGLQGRSGRVRKISPLPGFDTRTVQPVASTCIDSSVPVGKVRKINTICVIKMNGNVKI
jgi:hypothetical protein